MNKAQYLMEESEDIKNKLEFELEHERKAGRTRMRL